MHRSALLWVLATFVLSPSAAWAAEGCTINQVIGDVRIVREGDSIPAQESAVLQKGDRLETGPNCMSDMSMNDLAGCRVLADSRVEVKGWKPESMSLSVDKGNVILNLKDLPKESSFKLETPTAIATVRGTQFWGRVETQAAEETVSTFAVREGTVEIVDKSTSVSFTLEKGQALDLPKDSAIAPAVRDALPEEMQAMEQADFIPTGA